MTDVIMVPEGRSARRAGVKRRGRTAWSAYYSGVSKKRRMTKIATARASIKPGITRTGGFYGRYNPGPDQEMKFFDTALSFFFDATGEVPATGQLALIPQGDTESTRDGRMAYVKSIYIKGFLRHVPAAAATASTLAHMYLVLDTQANGGPAGVTDVLTSTTLSGALVNLANSGRFRILKKWTWAFNASAGVTTAYNNTSKYIQYFKRCDIPMHFNGTSGAIGEIRSNNIFLIAGSNADDDTVALSGSCRIRFYD